MLPCYFGDLCELVNQLSDLEQALRPGRTRHAVHRLVHRFDALIDQIAGLSLLEESTPVNDVEAPGGP